MQDLERLYETKDRIYFADARDDIQALVEGTSLAVLDVGCSDGSLGAALLESGKAAAVDGVEMNPTAASVAKQRLSRVYVDRVEAVIDALPDNTYDLLIIGDVLEHLLDPWSTAKLLVRKLKKGGRAIISVPNVQSIEVMWPLLRGRWNYHKDGILDRTHLRFFTRSTFRSLLVDSGVDVVTISGCFTGRRYSYVSNVSLGLLAPFLAQRWIAVARRT